MKTYYLTILLYIQLQLATIIFSVGICFFANTLVEPLACALYQLIINTKLTVESFFTPLAEIMNIVKITSH